MNDNQTPIQKNIHLYLHKKSKSITFEFSEINSPDVKTHKKNQNNPNYKFTYNSNHCSNTSLTERWRKMSGLKNKAILKLMEFLLRKKKNILKYLFNLIKGSIKKLSPTNIIFKKKHIVNNRPKIPIAKTEKTLYFTEKMKHYVVESFDFDSRHTYSSNKNLECLTGNSQRDVLKTEILLDKDIIKSVIIILMKFCLCLKMIYHKFIYCAYLKFLSNLELCCIQKFTRKVRMINYLNQVFALRNILTSNNYHKNKFYRCYLIKWKSMIIKKSKSKIRSLHMLLYLRKSKKANLLMKMFYFKMIRYITYPLYRNDMTRYIYSISNISKINALIMTIKMRMLFYCQLNYGFNSIKNSLLQFVLKDKDTITRKIRTLKIFIENIDNTTYQIEDSNSNKDLIRIKEKYNLRKLNNQKSIKLFKFLVKIVKIKSINKRVSIHFKHWNRIILNENFNEVLLAIDRLKNDNDVLNLKLFIKIINNKLGNLFRNLFENSAKRITSKYFTLSNDFTNTSIFENFYNKKLFNNLLVIDKITNLIERHKSNFLGKKYNNSIKNKIGYHFENWKNLSMNLTFYLNKSTDVIDNRKNINFNCIFYKLFLMRKKNCLKILLRNDERIIEIYKRKENFSKEMFNFLSRNCFSIKLTTFSYFKRLFLHLNKSNHHINKYMSGLNFLENFFNFSKKIAFIDIRFFSEFSYKIKENDKEKEEKIKKLISGAQSFYNSLNFIFLQIKKIFFSKFSKIFKIRKKNIDYFILSNVSEVNVNIEKEINKKVKLLSNLSSIQKMLHLKRKYSATYKYSTLSKFVYKWRHSYIIESKKHSILEELEDYSKINIMLLNRIEVLNNNTIKYENSLKMCTIRAEKCRLCFNMVNDDEFSCTMPSLKEEKLAINNIPTFTTKSLKKDIKKEYLRTKTIEFNKTLKSSIAILINDDNLINENPDHESYNTLDESTGQEYYTYLEDTYKDLYSKLQEIDFEYAIKINTLKSDIDDLMIELDGLVNRKNLTKY